MWDIAVLLLVLVICLVLHQFVYRKNGHNSLADAPCLSPLPLLGNLTDMFKLLSGRGNIPTFTRLFQYLRGMTVLFQDKGMFVLWVGPKPLLYLFSPERAQEFFKNDFAEETSVLHKYAEPWLGNGLITSKGKEWRRQRKLLNQTFNARLLDNFIPIMNEKASILVENIRRSSSTRHNFDLYYKCTLDIICETIMGAKTNTQRSESIYARKVDEALEGMFARLERLWLQPYFVFIRSEYGRRFQSAVDYLHDFSNKIIADKMSKRRLAEHSKGVSDEMLQSPPKRSLALMDLLVESELSQLEIRDQVNTFIVAGFDTTGSVVGWITYCLGLYSDVQERLFEEVDSAFSGDKNRHATDEDLKKLKYMEMVIKESLRMYPPAPLIPKKLSNDTEIGGCLIPKGTECIISAFCVHRCPKHYVNPEVFDPERFSAENSAGRHPAAFLPFSAGVKNCPGQRYAMMELKIIVSHILRHFRIVSLDPPDKIQLLPAGSLRPMRKINMKFISREY